MRLLVVLLVCFSLSAAAQEPQPGNFRIGGSVMDSASRNPLDYVTVSLKTEKGDPIKTTLTDASGRFSFTGVQPAAYTVIAVSVSYQAKSVGVVVKADGIKNYNAGVIYLSPTSNQLKEVVVTADKPVIRKEIDRLSYDLQADPESRGSSVLEMMRKVPMLSLDAEENIMLKGNTNYRILVNGKPSSMMERNAKDVLRSMPASSIERIEVITTPPAKYDGEGLAGIINIITNKKVDNGYNGSVNVNGRFPAGGPGGGTSFTMRSGKFGLALNGGGSLYDNPSLSNSRYRETFGGERTILQQWGTNQSDGRNGYLNTELSFEPDSLHLISGQFNINGDRSASSDLQRSMLNNDGGLAQGYQLLNNYRGKGNGLDAGINYQLGFRADKNRLLTFSYRWFGFVNRRFNSVEVSEPVNFSDPDYRQNDKGRFAEQTIQADYVHPVKKLTIEGGLKMILRKNKSNFGYFFFDAQEGGLVADLSRTNNYDNTQNVLAAYNTWQYNLKDWGFKAGARIEYTVIDADFTSAGAQVRREYLNLIPSVSVNRNLTKASSLNFGYTTRIQRPGIDLLNPFVDRANPYLESSGNPGLEPSTVDMFQLNYSNFKKGSLNAGLMLGFFHGLIMPVSVFDSETSITRTSYGNTGSARLLGLQLNFSYPLTKKWKYNLNSNVAYGVVKGLVNGGRTSNEGWMPYAYTSMEYRMEKGWNLNANVAFYGQSISLQARTNEVLSSSFGINRELVKDKISFSASASNPFTRLRSYERFTDGVDFTQRTYDESYFRSFSASLNYRFGKLKDGIKKSRRSIRNDDVSGGGM